jgi:hypothetical protein
MLPEMEREYEMFPGANANMSGYLGRDTTLRLIRALKRAHALIEKWRLNANSFIHENRNDQAMQNVRDAALKRCADELSRALDDEA